ncbi:MAG: AAA family ATPase, partial [Caldiserica bacterium]|nr:AAA family ATPase [Caldisericota bacterium]
TMFQSLTGRLPVETKKISSIAYNILNALPEPPSKYNPEVSKDIDQIIISLLRRDPKERTQTAKELINQLETVVSTDQHGSTSSNNITVSIPNLFGRDEEMDCLFEQFENSKSSPCSVVLSGPFGIGKSRLAEEFAIKAQLGGSIVLRAHGVSSSIPEPLLGLRQLFWHLQYFSAFDVIDKNSDEFISLASMNQAMMNKYKIKTINVKAGDSDRLEAFKTVMGVLSSTHRIIVLFDDFDHVDKETLEMCASLTTSLKRNFMLVLTSDDMESTEISPSLGKKNHSIDLSPIGDIEGFIKSALDVDDVPKSLVESVTNNTGGVPMLILDQLRSDVVSGSLQNIDHCVIFLPEKTKSIETSDYIAGIIDTLTVKERFVLDFAGVYNNRFTAGMLCQVLGIEQREVNSIVDELVKYGLLSSQNESSIVYYWLPKRFINQISRMIKRDDYKAFNTLLARYLENTTMSKPHWIFKHYNMANQEDKALLWAENTCWQMLNDQSFDVTPYLDYIKKTGLALKDKILLLKVSIIESSLEARAGNIMRSLEMIDECIHNSIFSQKDELLVKSLKVKSEILKKARMVWEAIDVERSLVFRTPRICTDEDEYEIFSSLSILYLQLYDLADALKYARLAQETAKKLDSTKLEDSTYKLAVRLIENQRISEAYSLTKESLDSSEIKGQFRLNMLSIYPSTLWYKGEIDKACTVMSQILSEIPFNDLSPRTIINFAQITHSAGQPQLSMDILKKTPTNNSSFSSTLIELIKQEIDFETNGWQNVITKVEMLINKSKDSVYYQEVAAYGLLVLGTIASHVPNLELAAKAFRQAWSLAKDNKYNIAALYSGFTILTAINQPLLKTELKSIAEKISEIPEHPEDKMAEIYKIICMGMSAIIDAKSPVQIKIGYKTLSQAKTLAITCGHKQIVGLLGKLLGKLHWQEYRFSGLAQDKELALQNFYESEFIYRTTGANWLADFVSDMINKTDR